MQEKLCKDDNWHMNNHLIVQSIIFLKVFVSDLQPCFKMVSRNTMRMNCLKIYEEEMVSLYELFDKLDCRFSFTSDL
jgi:hypothetical protein